MGLILVFFLDIFSILEYNLTIDIHLISKEMEENKMKYVFIHGMSQKPSSWDQVISNLQEKESFYILCPDWWSLLNGKEATYENIYNSFVDYINNHNSEKIPLNLCGLSFGGVLALNYALDFPEKVNSLVLIGSLYEFSEKLVKSQNTMFKIMPTSAFKKMGLVKKDMITLNKSFIDLDFTQKLMNISCPTLILCGENDRKMFKEAANYLNENIPNSQFAFIKDAGHNVNTENPKELALKIDKFLKM